LIVWDPSLLIDTDEYYGWLPLHSAAGLWTLNVSIRGFQLVFEAGIIFFPKKKGINLLFRETIQGYDTPFRLACENFGHEKVMEVVEDTLARCYASSDNTPPLNIEEALLSAAIDENIHLDCVYFLLRREPDILQKVLSSSSSSSITTNSTETIVTKINPKKRKKRIRRRTTTMITMALKK
jgi:hypothetical protein